MTNEEAIKRIQDFIGWFKKDKPLYEALEMAIQALEKENIYDDKEHYVTISKALYDKLNIDYEQALSQEPTEKPMTVDEMEREYEKSKALFHKIVECEDAISRKAVNTLVDELARAISDERCHIPQRGRDTGHIMHDILDLPPVTPKQKIGRWIDDKCSVCGKGIEDLIDSREWYRNEEPNFCPFCGVRVVESEE